MDTGTAVITQPTYLPWLGYFQQMARAQHFVFLDSVQYVARSWHSRNRLRARTGEVFWLSVPVEHASRATPLGSIRIARDHDWPRRHLQSLRMHLGKAPFFELAHEVVAAEFAAGHEYLADLNVALISRVATLLGLSPRFARASAMAGDGARSQLLLSLCCQLGVRRYHTSAGSRAYLEVDEPMFADAGISVSYQDWPHPEYPQQGAGFISHLSVVDTLANLGAAGTAALLVAQPGSVP